MFLTEYDAKKQRRLDRRDAFNEGLNEGHKEGLTEGRKEGLTEGFESAIMSLINIRTNDEEIIKVIMDNRGIDSTEATELLDVIKAKLGTNN